MKGIILFFSFVSLIITLLGVYSAITLDTERRQKEVAIRKVNGAGLKQIIILFARTYIYQLVLSAAIAFPLCYAILQLWKTCISYSLMTARYLDFNLHNRSCHYYSDYYFRILKIARTNPAEVIKTNKRIYYIYLPIMTILAILK